MGKSDIIIFEEYKSMLDEIKESFNSVAFLGFSQENSFTKSVDCPIKNFYDLSLNNWNINDDWVLKQKYDLIVCTRCAYFSKDPQLFIDKCKQHLTVNGHALVDWGLGDHWRFQKYKVGWQRDDEHEFAYAPDNFLYSCYWDDSLLSDTETNLFWKFIVNNPKFGYSNIEDFKKVVEKEVPNLVKYKTEKIKTVFLWPDNPQLYIITLIKNNLC